MPWNLGEVEERLHDAMMFFVHRSKMLTHAAEQGGNGRWTMKPDQIERNLAQAEEAARHAKSIAEVGGEMVRRRTAASRFAKTVRDTCIEIAVMTPEPTQTSTQHHERVMEVLKRRGLDWSYLVQRREEAAQGGDD